MHSILKISRNRMSKPGANENRSGRGKQNLFWDMCSLRMYSKKQVVFHDVLLAQKTAQKVIWISRFSKGTPQLWSLLMWDVSDRTADSKITQHMCEMVASQPGRGTWQADTVVGGGGGTAAVPWMESMEGLLHSFSDPFAPFLQCSTALSTSALEKKDSFNSIWPTSP